MGEEEGMRANIFWALIMCQVLCEHFSLTSLLNPPITLWGKGSFSQAVEPRRVIFDVNGLEHSLACRTCYIDISY